MYFRICPEFWTNPEILDAVGTLKGICINKVHVHFQASIQKNLVIIASNNTLKRRICSRQFTICRVRKSLVLMIFLLDLYTLMVLRLVFNSKSSPCHGYLMQHSVGGQCEYIWSLVASSWRAGPDRAGAVVCYRAQYIPAVLFRYRC